ncbi:hypothetical protein IF1G_02483 [Cordyceps javanica]|uniref:Uncharacterized protein n=1 Tax=Cordyceps javanica TaxID=43265 RepID=A0A545V9K8_9HYPO|nr:hypothetical protein IF1G_02483 [Cordyceps javanica]
MAQGLICHLSSALSIHLNLVPANKFSKICAWSVWHSDWASEGWRAPCGSTRGAGSSCQLISAAGQVILPRNHRAIVLGAPAKIGYVDAKYSMPRRCKLPGTQDLHEMTRFAALQEGVGVAWCLVLLVLGCVPRWVDAVIRTVVWCGGHVLVVCTDND